MRTRPLRDLDAGSWIDLFLVAAVTAILAIRGYLELTDYPKIGGGGLHVAHMLWGGLLMLVALWMLLFALGRRVRPVAAVVGGLGFGTFIDEVGKFVTADNDYFFEPAIAIMYGTLASAYVIARWIEQRTRPAPVDHLATALRDLEETLLDDLDADERRRILERLDRSRGGGHDDLVAAIRAHVTEATLVDAAAPRWTTRWSRAVLERYRRLARARWAVFGVIAFFVGQLLIKLGYGVWFTIGAWRGVRDPFVVLTASVSEAGLLASSIVSGVFVAFGARALLGGRRAEALRRFQASVLVTLLVGQPFQFNLEQWSALTGLALNLLLFFALRYAIEHERDLDA